MEVLFLVGADPLSDCPDKELAALALERARFVVAVDALPTASTAHADVVLPAAIYTERRGTFTNIEGRISWLGKKVTAPGTARPDWMIAVELARHLGGDLGASSLEDLWAEIESVSALHRGVSKALHESLSGRDGVVVPLGLDGGPEAHHEAPEPLDPMADPGIASADTHPVPPAAGIALVSTPDGSPSADAATSLLTPPPRVQLGPRAAHRQASRTGDHQDRWRGRQRTDAPPCGEPADVGRRSTHPALALAGVASPAARAARQPRGPRPLRDEAGHPGTGQLPARKRRSNRYA